MTRMNTSYTPATAVSSCLRRYIQFSGRASRSEYWWWVITTTIISAILGWLASDTGGDSFFFSILASLYSAFIFLPGLAVLVRRLHDSGRSAWNLLWWLLPAIGWIILVILLCLPGSDRNIYGDAPEPPLS